MSEALTKIESMPSPAIEPTTPQALMRRATDVASVCREIVLKTAVQIQGRKFLRVEGWESIATAHGCFAGAEDAERAYDNQGNHIGYKAQGVLRNAHGEVIATGEGFVGFDEKDRKGNPTWKNRDEYAGRAMAQTRAISRTCRGVFAHVVVLIDAGLSTTPAEEIPDGGFDDADRAAKAKPVTAKAKPANVPQKTQSEDSTVKLQIKWRKWLVEQLHKIDPPHRDEVDGGWTWQYFLEKQWVGPEETLSDMLLTHLPLTLPKATELLTEVQDWIAERKRQAELDAQKPQGTSGPPSDTSPPAKDAGKAAKQAPTPQQQVDGPAPDHQPWFNAVVPVPYAGMKRDEYLKRPDTIGELYNARHDDDQARRRLFGFLHNFQPKGWTNRQGKQMPPSKADLEFRDQLDAFGEWFEENHPDEVKND